MKYTLDYEKYAELARRVAAEGSVLLRNEDGVLPLQKGQRVSIFGRTQFEHYKSGTGSGGMSMLHMRPILQTVSRKTAPYR